MVTKNWAHRHAMTNVDISMSAEFFLPMYCEMTPSGNRSSAPAKIGIESMNPVSAGDNLKCSVMKGAIAPLRTQTAKQKSK